MEVIELERTIVMIILLVVKVILDHRKSILNHAMKKNVRQIGPFVLSGHKKKVEQASSKFFIQMELITARVNLKA